MEDTAGLHRKYQIWSNIVLSIEFIVRVEHFIIRTSCHNARVIYSHAVGP